MTGSPRRPEPDDCALIGQSETTGLITAKENSTNTTTSSTSTSAIQVTLEPAPGSAGSKRKLKQPKMSLDKCHESLAHDHSSRQPVHPLHPHQLAHQHTYPKISLTSIPSTGCIQEEDEFGDDNGGGGGGGGGEKRRLSAQYLNGNRAFGFDDGQHECNCRRRHHTDDDFDSRVQLFSPGAISTGAVGSGTTSGGGATIPRTFSTSALRIKNRCSFWDRMQTTPR